jgi:hypothetical protein
MESQIIMGSVLKIVATDRLYVELCQLRQACARSYVALKLLYVDMCKEFNIGGDFNLGCSWARVHRGLEIGRKRLGRKMMRADARLGRVVVTTTVGQYQHDPGNALICHAGPACDKIKSILSTYT